MRHRFNMANHARPSSLWWLGLHHYQGWPPRYGLSLTQLDIDGTMGVETHFGQFTHLKVFRWEIT